MKRFAILLILTLPTLAFTALAQGTNAVPPGHQMLASPEAFAAGHLAALDNQVHLSADQKPKLQDVFLQEGKELFAVFGDGSLSDAQKHARIQQLHVATQSRVWNLLTHEQRKQMSESPAPPRPVT
jgi:Spy/CpxP family protein refolding chaperone